MKLRQHIQIFFLILLSSLVLYIDFVKADKVKFQEGELATESVLPVFDKRVVVKNRNVVKEGRFDFGITAGFSLTEPFYSPYNVGGLVGYHWHEQHSVHIALYKWMGGLSGYSDQLQTDYHLNLKYAPSLNQITFLCYQYTPYYGKMSLIKDMMMNLNFFGTLGVGSADFGGKSFPGLALGIGQNFFWNDIFAVRFDLRFLFNQGPDVTSLNLKNETGPVPVDDFSTMSQFNSFLSVGITILI